MDSPQTPELDLRELPPPEPLQRTLETLPTLGRRDVLTIRTMHRPLHLEAELKDRGYDSDSDEVGHNHWETRIWRRV